MFDIIHWLSYLVNWYECPLLPEVIEVKIDLCFGLKIDHFQFKVKKFNFWCHSWIEAMRLVFFCLMMRPNEVSKMPNKKIKLLSYSDEKWKKSIFFSHYYWNPDQPLMASWGQNDIFSWGSIILSQMQPFFIRIQVKMPIFIPFLTLGCAPHFWLAAGKLEFFFC